MREVMHNNNLHLWQHDHSFGQEIKRAGEARTMIVIVITATMMVVEIVAGLAFGSMALLADGLHMASHAVALSITAFAYFYARRHAHDERFSFGTGKMNALGGFTGAVLLAVFALMMAWESVDRLIHPVAIAFNHAILVAVLGLIVNGASMLILEHKHQHGHDHDHGGESDHNHHHSDYNHDHNLRAAYLHVLADALTSVLAIFALLAGKYFRLVWMDPVMGLIGSLLVARWSYGLLCITSGVLLDRQGPSEIRARIREAIEQQDDNRVAELHLWSIGPGIYALIVVVVSHQPQPPDHYRGLIPVGLGIVHATVEVHECREETNVEEADESLAQVENLSTH